MTDPCNDCGSTTYTMALVDTDGAVTCAACFVGLTPLLRAGIPIAPLDQRPEVDRKVRR